MKPKSLLLKVASIFSIPVLSLGTIFLFIPGSGPVLGENEASTATDTAIFSEPNTEPNSIGNKLAGAIDRGAEGKYYIQMPTGDFVAVWDTCSPNKSLTAELNRWEGETRIKIGIPLNDGTLEATNKTISWHSYNENYYEARVYYDDTTEMFKFDLIMKKKPSENVINFNFDSQGLIFYYQPPLTQEYISGWSEEFKRSIFVSETEVIDADTGEVLVHCPQNLIGSYAAYRINHSNLYTSAALGEKYKCGKAFHIYRPLIIDANGEETWGELHIGNRVMSITIPQQFLDKAAYPVLVDPTFGYTTKGSRSTTSANIIKGSWATGLIGTASSISAFIQYNASANIKFGLYTKTETLAGNLVAETEQGIVPSGWNNWMTLPFNAPQSISAADYWLFLWHNGSTSSFYDLAETNKSGYLNLEYGINGSYPETVNLTGQTRIYSIYCTCSAVTAPVVNSIYLYDANHQMETTAMTPQTEYAIKITLSDNDTLADLSIVKVTIFFDPFGSYNPQEVPSAGYSKTAAILTCNVGASPVWSIEPGSNTTWGIFPTDCVQPPLSNTSGDFWFHFKPSKVAVSTSNGGKWHINVKAIDKEGLMGENYQANLAMNWYGEIFVQTSNIDFGNVTLGSDFSLNFLTGIAVNYICNGTYSQQIRTDPLWCGSKSSIVLNQAGDPQGGEFSLKANNSNDFDSAILVSADYATIDTKTGTEESGNEESSNTLWLKLGRTGIPSGEYRGTIYYRIIQD